MHVRRFLPLQKVKHGKFRLLNFVRQKKFLILLCAGQIIQRHKTTIN